MAGDDKKMTDMKPIKRKGSLLERADQRFDFGGTLRRLEPGALGDGPVVDAEPVVRVTARDNRRRAAAAAAAAPPPAEAASVDPLPADAPPAAETPQAASVPVEPRQPATRQSRGLGAARSSVPVVNRRFVPRAPMQSVDRALLASHGLIDPDGNVGALAEEYRIIKRQLLRAAVSADFGQRIVVTSAQPDEGKTFSTINLALSLAAEQDVSVILIDGDFVRAEVPKKLGLTPGKGLLDVLADPSIDLADCVIPTDIPRLSVLPSGTSTARDTESLSSARMDDILEQLDADAPDRIILFDSMPLLAASSAGVIAQHCGQVVVVVRADVTREAALRDAIGLIGQHHGISLLLNRVRFTPEGRRFGSYYGEGG